MAEQAFPAPGLSAFESLRAEFEPWLADCFVPPPEFELLAGPQALVFFGPPGSGKTALFEGLKRKLISRERLPTRLCFEWRPVGLGMPEPELDLVLAQTAATLVEALVRWPGLGGGASDNVRHTLGWFIERHLDRSDPERAAAGEGLNLPSQANPYLERARPGQLISQLVGALQRIGLSDICVLVGPESLMDASPESIQTLADFLSILEYFENPRLVFKLVLPESMKPAISQAGAAVRDRLRVRRLRWSTESLEEVVARRLALAAGTEIRELGEVTDYENLSLWLSRSGGDSPRGWLDQARPLAARYLADRKPVSLEAWRALREQHPPNLWIDREKRLVTVGRRTVRNFTPIEWAILLYLADNDDRICSREELYHEAHLPASGAQAAGQHFEPVEYEGALTNALLRLREEIEPDPRDPLYIVTYRGVGMRLEHAW